MTPSVDVSNLHLLSASEAAALIRDGIISSVQLVESCLARIRAVDPVVQAWAFLDPDYALAQARLADERRLTGQPTGALHGRRTDKPGDEGVGGLVIDFLRRADLAHRTGFHHRDAIAQPHRFNLIMRI